VNARERVNRLTEIEASFGLLDRFSEWALFSRR
jgi:hypothetical protein